MGRISSLFLSSEPAQGGAYSHRLLVCFQLSSLGAPSTNSVELLRTEERGIWE